MLRISIKPTGRLQAKIRALSQAVDKVPGMVSQAVRSSAIEVLGSARALVPVSTGMLHDSIDFDLTDNGQKAVIGSYLPYAAKQEFDASLNHSVRENRLRVINTRRGRVGSTIQGTGQFNPDATWGFLRKALAAERDNFIQKLRDIVELFARAAA